MKTIDGRGREVVRDYADRSVFLSGLSRGKMESPIKIWGLLMFVILFPLLLLFGPNSWGAEATPVPFEHGKSYQVAQGRVIQLHHFSGCYFSIFLYSVENGQVKINLAEFSAELTPGRAGLIGVTGEDGRSKNAVITCRGGTLVMSLPPGAEEYNYRD